MQSSFATSLTLLALVVGAATAARADEPTSINQAYQELRDGGCKVDDLGSPIVARALRNVPYARAGKIFKSVELTYLYGHDGGWYQPTDAAAEVAAEDRACVRKLGAAEQALRKRIKLKPAVEEAITRHAGAILDMQRLVLADFRKFTQFDRTAKGVRTWQISFEAGGGAALVTVECTAPAAAKQAPLDWSRLDCHVLAAG